MIVDVDDPIGGVGFDGNVGVSHVEPLGGKPGFVIPPGAPVIGCETDTGFPAEPCAGAELVLVLVVGVHKLFAFGPKPSTPRYTASSPRTVMKTM